MNIAVMFTGGTIASCQKGDYLGINTDSAYQILSIYKEKYADVIVSYDIHFHTLSPYQILSENLNGDYINQLVQCVRDAQTTHPGDMPLDGIIITHGTDTLQYSAAALGLTCKDTKLPILLVSSNYTLDDSRANGLSNFTAAVEYICQKKEAGVFVSYSNQGQSAVMYPATKLFAHLPYSDTLYTSDELIAINTLDNYAQDIDFASISLCEPSPVLFFHAMPGQIYPTLTDNIKAIIIESYHSGTLCTAGSSLKSFCENAFAKNIPIYLVGVEDRTAYESTKAYEELHIKVLPKVSPVTAYMLAWYLYSRK